MGTPEDKTVSGDPSLDEPVEIPVDPSSGGSAPAGRQDEPPAIAYPTSAQPLDQAKAREGGAEAAWLQITKGREATREELNWYLDTFGAKAPHADLARVRLRSERRKGWARFLTFKWLSVPLAALAAALAAVVTLDDRAGELMSDWFAATEPLPEQEVAAQPAIPRPTTTIRPSGDMPTNCGDVSDRISKLSSDVRLDLADPNLKIVVRHEVVADIDLSCLRAAFDALGLDYAIYESRPFPEGSANRISYAAEREQAAVGLQNALAPVAELKLHEANNASNTITIALGLR